MSAHAAQAQQAQGASGQDVQVVVPSSDNVPPPAAKDANAAAPAATPAPTAAAEPAKTETPAATAAAPAAAEPAKAAEPVKTAEPAAKPAEPTVTAEPAKPAAAPEPAKMAEPATPAPAAAPEKAAAAPAAPAPEKAAAAPAPAPVSATADNAVADKLRELVTGKALDRAVDRKAERTGVQAYYKAHDYAPVWVHDGAVTARAKAVMATLGKAADVGLDPTDYPTPDFAAATTADALAAAELKLTASALTYAREAQIGRIHYTRVSGDISFKLEPQDPAKVLAKLATAEDAGKTLDGYNPQIAEFKALREKLAELRAGKAEAAKPEAEKEAPTVRIASGPIMRPGLKDARVVQLRQRLKIEGDKDSKTYDEAVVEAVKAFQTQADLDADGNVGPATLAALNGEKHEARRAAANPIDTVIVNMERWRWYPRDLGNPHVIVNIPDYTLSLYNNNKVYWHTKIVVGKPGKATPLISAEMKFITVNPTWNVPPSIIEKEYLPALQQDPNALDRIGLKLTQDANGIVHIQQPPGAGNALGRIRFNFPNKFLVYQHDTPDKYLFKKEKRAYSHGCMRVLNPFTYGEKLLSLALPEGHYTQAKLESMVGNSEININFPKPLWVHLTYQTAFVDENGKLQFRDDIYGTDAKMIGILKGSDRKVADLAIERPPNQSSKPVRMPVGMYGGDRNYSSGPNFFEMLFGGGRTSEVDNSSRSLGPRYGRDGRLVTR
ncbi:MAG: L,D-transpeptidase family protein [Rhodopseudomonas sp.]|nr:L,D-transpeptidase family protein [Rhodopseudomonas sp.]